MSALRTDPGAGQRVAGLTDRRGFVRRTITGAAAAVAALAGTRRAEVGAGCFRRGRRCRSNRQCCTRNCRFGECR